MSCKRALTIVCFLVISAGCRTTPLPHPERMTFSPLCYTPIAPERIECANGMTLFFLEDHELPLVEATVLVKAGSIHDPPDRAGLASLTGTLIRTGGTRGMSPESIDASLDALGAEVAVAVNPEETSATFSAHAEDFEAVFRLFAAMLNEPACKPDKLKLAQDNLCQSLRRLPDNPQQFAMREFKKLLYQGNPRGNLPTLSSVRRVTRDDILSFHRNHFYLRRMYLGICGDVSRERALKIVESCFPASDEAPRDASAVADPRPPAADAIHHLQLLLPQSTIIAGQFAPSKNDPDFYGFQVLDHIIGSSGFTSRLMSRVRTELGLAYSVGSFYQTNPRFGVFGVYCMTKSSSTFDALQTIREILVEMTNSPPSESELGQAKEALINSFVFTAATSYQILMQHMTIAFDNLPHDFYTAMPDRIRSVTASDIVRIARTRLRPDDLLTFILGDAQSFDRQTGVLARLPVRHTSSDLIAE